MPLRVELEVPAGLQLTLTVIAVGLLGTSAILSFGRPPTGFDALSYHGPMAVYFWRDGNIVSLLDRAPFGFAMAHPGAAELWLGLLRSGFGERAANLGQLPFALLGAAAGALVGFAIGDGAETIAGGIGGALGALSGAAIVYGALRRGATRLGLAAYVGAIGILVCLVALIPVAGYVTTVGVPLLAARLRGRRAARYAGLRTLAK